MIVQRQPPVHLTYCLNVHPGETWAENLSAIRDKALRVRTLVGPEQRFGLGLRLSRQAAEQLNQPGPLAEFRSLLAQHGLYVFTVNGFPYGRFHGTAVKQDVYAPDWRTPQRRDYTVLLADLMAALLPAGVDGSISTVPVSYKPWAIGEEGIAQSCRMLADTCAHLARIREEAGREVHVALEPEPDCLLETTAEAVEFFNGPLLHHGVRHLCDRHGMNKGRAEEVLHRHPGLCLDTAHAAVQFEDLGEAVALLKQGGIRLAKVQLSAALRVELGEGTREALRAFCDEVYLHQVKARLPEGRTVGFADLPAVLATPASRLPDRTELRVHFHVPLFFDAHDALRSTSDLLLAEDFRGELRNGVSEHLEIETYTFGVLPEELRRDDVTDSIAEEYRWVLRELLG